VHGRKYNGFYLGMQPAVVIKLFIPFLFPLLTFSNCGTINAVKIYTTAILAAASMDQILSQQFEKFNTHGKLPSPRGVALQVIHLTERNDTTAHQVAKLINNDPSLASRILKSANILVRREGRPVTSIVDAVTVLGFKSVRQLALSLSLVADFSSGTCAGFDYQRFWAHSVCSGVAAQQLITRMSIGVADEAFLLGLLSQIGRLSLATVFPEQYAKVLVQAAETHNLSKLEQNTFGLNHNQITSLMLSDWGMPEIFQTIAMYLELPDASPFAEGSRSWRLLQLFHFSDRLAEFCTAPPADRLTGIPKLMLLSTRLGFETDTLIEIGDIVIKEMSEWGSLLNLAVPATPPFKEILGTASIAHELTGGETLSGAAAESVKLRILLVEDDRSMQLLYKNMLEKSGHKVTTANNGREALDIVKKSPPQLIISDWMMPEMNGIEFCKAMRQNEEWSQIYIFIVTAQESTDKLVEAFEAGVDDYLSKPINPKVLGARLRAAQRIIQMQEAQEQDHLQLHKFADELALSNQRLQELALTDVLTGLPNRRYGIDRLEQEWANATRSGHPVCCMMVDVDRFKLINDTHGHHLGDEALKMVAASLRHAARKEDVVCRLGGEEFLVICANTNEDACFHYAERLRQQVDSHPLQVQGKTLHITVSIGLSSNTNIGNVESMMHIADKRLYAAKAAGRNRTIAG
jgi:diguanylate cyclase (GGDEF)-like protein